MREYKLNRNFEELFDGYEKNRQYDIFNNYEDTNEEMYEGLRITNVNRYALQTIPVTEDKRVIDAKSYPTHKKSQKQFIKKCKQDPLVQWRHNQKRKRIRINYLINGNFGYGDLWIMLDYRGGEEPKTEKEAKKDVENYIRRLQYRVKKFGYPDLKYLYVTEYGEKFGRAHHHMVCNFPNIQLAKELWKKGIQTQVDVVTPDERELDGMANYFTKQFDMKDQRYNKPEKEPSKMKAYGYSLGLYKPWLAAKPPALSKMTKKKAHEILTGRIDAKEHFEKLYPGYTFVYIEKESSDYVSGCYLKVRMRRNE